MVCFGVLGNYLLDFLGFIFRFGEVLRILYLQVKKVKFQREKFILSLLTFQLLNVEES